MYEFDFSVLTFANGWAQGLAVILSQSMNVALGPPWFDPDLLLLPLWCVLEHEDLHLPSP
jgi:hypothetical protein